MNASHTAVYLFAGDSLTEGLTGASYVERIARALAQGRGGLRGRAVNAGRSCDTAASLLARLDDALLSARPDWVVLAVGTNDAWLPWLAGHGLGWWAWLLYRRLRWHQAPARDLDRFAATYRALIDHAGADGTRVLACTVGPAGEDLSSPLNGQVARLNGAIKRVAADCRVPVADVWQACVDDLIAHPHPSRHLPVLWWSAWQDRRRLRTGSPDDLSRGRRLRLTFDGIHLNSRGADLWAATILAALARAGASTR